MHDRRDDPTFENAEEGRKYTADRQSIVRTALVPTQRKKKNNNVRSMKTCNKITMSALPSPLKKKASRKENYQSKQERREYLTTNWY